MVIMFLGINLTLLVIIFGIRINKDPVETTKNNKLEKLEEFIPEIPEIPEASIQDITFCEPTYKKFFKFGKESHNGTIFTTNEGKDIKILISYESSDLTVILKEYYALLKKPNDGMESKVFCKKILGSHAQTLLIECPIPYRLQNSTLQLRLEKTTYHYDAITEFAIENPVDVAICHNSNENYSKKGKIAAAGMIGRDRDIEYLFEFLEYHLLLGIDHFFIYYYNKEKEKNYEKIKKKLKYYIDKNLVSFFDWNKVIRNPNRHQPDQVASQSDAIGRFGDFFEFFAMIDFDEFIFPLHTDSIKTVLEKIENRDTFAGFQMYSVFMRNDHLKNEIDGDGVHKYLSNEMYFEIASRQSQSKSYKKIITRSDNVDLHALHDVSFGKGELPFFSKDEVYLAHLIDRKYSENGKEIDIESDEYQKRKKRPIEKFLGLIKSNVQEREREVHGLINDF